MRMEARGGMTCMCCGSDKEDHDCKSDHFKKNLSTEGAVKEESKTDPKGEGTEAEDTTKSSV